jgi:hypothetical protein
MLQQGPASCGQVSETWHLCNTPSALEHKTQMEYFGSNGPGHHYCERQWCNISRSFCFVPSAYCVAVYVAWTGRHRVSHRQIRLPDCNMSLHCVYFHALFTRALNTRICFGTQQNKMYNCSFTWYCTCVGHIVSHCREIRALTDTEHITQEKLRT